MQWTKAMVKILTPAMLALLLMHSPALADACPVKDKPYTIHFDTGGKIQVKRMADGILYYESIDKAGQKTEMAVAQGLFVMATVTAQGPVIFQYDSDPRQLRQIPQPGEKITAQAKVISPGGGESRHTTTVSYIGTAKLAVGGCQFDAVRLNVAQNANGVAVATERYFVPDLMISLRTVITRSIGSTTNNAIRFESP